MKDKYDREIEGERWEQIDEYEDWYEISDFGRVKRVKAARGTYIGRILKPSINSNGYSQVKLCKNGKEHSVKAHVLVTNAFIGPCPDGMERNHMDGDKTNNRLDNLEYVTPSENVTHAFVTGLAQHRGEKHSSSKLTESNVHEIRRLSCEELQESMAKRFGVSSQSISAVVTGITWSWLKEEEESNGNQ